MRRSLGRTLILLCLAIGGAVLALMLYNSASATVSAVVTNRAIPQGAITVVEDFRTVEVSARMLESPDQTVMLNTPAVLNQLVGKQAKVTIPKGIPPAVELFREPEIEVPPGMRLLRLPVDLVEPSQSVSVGDRVDVYLPHGSGFLTPEIYSRAAEQVRWLPPGLKALPIEPDVTLTNLMGALTGDAGGLAGDELEQLRQCFERQATFAAPVKLARPEVAIGLEVLRLWTDPDTQQLQATLMVPVEIFPELMPFSAAEGELGLKMTPVPAAEPTPVFDTEDINTIVQEQAEVFDVIVEDETCHLLWEEGMFGSLGS